MDCNNCIHLNMTEGEQTDKKEPHICYLYMQRVFHMNPIKFNGKHNKFIYPCRQCEDDGFKNAITRVMG